MIAPSTAPAVPLGIGGRLVESTLVRGSHPVRGRAVVVNLAPSPMGVTEKPTTEIAPFSSTVLIDTGLTGVERALLLRPRADAARIVDEPGWALLGDLLAADADGPPFPGDVPLWRGPSHEVGSVTFDPATLVANGSPAGRPVEFAVRVNLWFAPAGTDCVIHNEHGFIEIHTQIHGLGRMQKFRTPDPRSLYEDIAMSPGTTHAPFGSTTAGGGLVHPWHQYRADTDCIWLAVEYHRTTGPTT